MKKYIATGIKNIYSFHDYEISKTRLMELAEILLTMKGNATKENIDLFFKMVLNGVYGVLFKMPTCLTSMYHRHLLDKKNPFM